MMKQKKSVKLLMVVMAEKILDLSHQKLDKAVKIVSHFQKNLNLLNSVRKTDLLLVSLLKVSERKKIIIQEETLEWIFHLILVLKKKKNIIILSLQFQLNKQNLKKKRQDSNLLVIMPQQETPQKLLRDIPQNLKIIVQIMMMKVLLLLSHNHQETQHK